MTASCFLQINFQSAPSLFNLRPRLTKINGRKQVNQE